MPSAWRQAAAAWALASFLVVLAKQAWYSTRLTATYIKKTVSVFVPQTTRELPTLKRKCLRWSGPMSRTCSKTGGSQWCFVQSSCRIETGCLPWNSWMSFTADVALAGPIISSLDKSPFLSILMSSDSGSKVPSPWRPRPSPGCQPIFCSNFMPTPPATGAALVNKSFLTQAWWWYTLMHDIKHYKCVKKEKHVVFPSLDSIPKVDITLSDLYITTIQLVFICLFVFLSVNLFLFRCRNDNPASSCNDGPFKFVLTRLLVFEATALAIHQETNELTLTWFLKILYLRCSRPVDQLRYGLPRHGIRVVKSGPILRHRLGFLRHNKKND